MIPIVLAMDSGSISKMDPLIKSINQNIKNPEIYLITDKNINVSWAHKIKVITDINNINSSMIFYISWHMWYRLFIDIAFPELEKCIYLDYDTIVLDDISELLDGDDWCIRGVKDYMRERGCNSGVLAFNFKNKFCKYILEICRKNIREDSYDQRVINEIAQPYIEWVDYIYNMFPAYYEEEKTPKIMHYIGPVKPITVPITWKYYFDYYD